MTGEKRSSFSLADAAVYGIILLMVLGGVLALANGIIDIWLFLVLLALAFALPVIKYVVQPWLLGSVLRQEAEKLKLKEDIIETCEIVNKRLCEKYTGLGDNTVWLPSTYFIHQGAGLWVGFYDPKDAKAVGNSKTSLEKCVVEFDLFSKKVVGIRKDETADIWEKEFHRRFQHGYFTFPKERKLHVLLPREAKDVLDDLSDVAETAENLTT